MQKFRRVTTSLAVTAVLLGGAACGDDGDDVPQGGSETPPSPTTSIGSGSGNTITPPDLSTSSTRT